MTAFSTKEHLGYVKFKKIAGQIGAGPALNTEMSIPVTDASSTNPQNNTYPGVANSFAGSVGVVKGKHSPRITIATCAHSAFFTSVNVNDWIGGSASYLDTNYDTSKYAILRNEPVIGNQIFTGGKCQSISIMYNAGGGPIGIMMDWPCIYGADPTTEDGSPPSFSAYTPVTGQYYNTSDVTLTGFDQDRSFVLTLFRAQAYQWNNTTDLYAQAITSHGFAATLAIEQSPSYSSTLSTSGTIQIGPAATGIKFTCQLNKDNVRRTFPGNAPGSHFAEYSCADISNVNSSGYGVVIAVGS